MAKPSARDGVLPLRNLLCAHEPNSEGVKARLVIAIEEGDFDGTDLEPGLFDVDPVSGDCRAIRWKEDARKLKWQCGQDGRAWSVDILMMMGGPRGAISSLIESGQLGASPDAYARFCRLYAAESSKFRAEPAKPNRHSGGAPPKVADRIVAWFQDQPPEVKKLGNSQLEDQYMAAAVNKGVGKKGSVRGIIRRLREAGILDLPGN